MNSKQNKWEQFAQWWVEFADHNKKSLLVTGLFIFLIALIPIKSRLKINNDLASLLPQGTPSVIALEESYQRFGSTDKFMIAIESDDPIYIAKLQDTIAQKINSNWKDDAVFTQIDRDNSFFEEHALLYLPVNHLETLLDDLSDLKRELNQSYNPLSECLINCAEKKTDGKKKKRVWFDASIPQELGLPDEAAEAFNGFLEKKESKKKTQEKKDRLPESIRNRSIGKTHEGKWVGIVSVKLVRPSTDLTFVEHILARSDSLIASVMPKTKTHPLRIQVEGTYEGLKEVEALKTDGIVSFVISFILIIFLVVWFFRSWKAPILLLSQIIFACTLMLSFTALTYGQLNPFTLFVSAIIMGMGIDYSIHLMGSVQNYFLETGDQKLALKKTLAHLTYPMFLAALTTVAGLLTLLVADFTGFYEFGVIASAGIVLSFFSAILGLPVMILSFGGLPKHQPRSFFPKHWKNQNISQLVNRLAIGFILFSIVFAFFMPWLGFEHDFKKLRKPKSVSEKSIHTGVAQKSTRKSSQPAAVMGDDPKELDILNDSLMERLHTEKDPLLRSFLTLKTFVPPAEEQDNRMEIIDEIADLVSARVFDQAKSNDAKMIKKLRDLTKTEPFEAKDIPPWALNLLKEKDGTYGKIGFIYGNYPSWDANKVAEFQDRYGHWNINGNKLRVFSSQFILSDVIRAVKKDSLKMSVLISIVLILTLVFSLRNLAQIFVSFGSLAMGVLLTLGLMGFLTMLFGNPKVGIYNVIVIPTILGVGIDSTIHLLIAWTRSSTPDLRKLFDTTGRMVIASSLTTAAGFLGVLFVSHKGMQTIGQLAVLGIMTTLIAALIMTPWLSSKWIHRN